MLARRAVVQHGPRSPVADHARHGPVEVGTVVDVSELEPRPEPGPVADPLDLRCSDADREAVAEVIRQAAGDGRLTLDEHGERLDAVYAARTYRDLLPVVADLPGAAVPGVPQLGRTPGDALAPRAGNRVVPGGVAASDNAVAIFSETKRTGAWLVPADYASVAVFGSVELDLREASMASNQVQIQANAIFGEVKVIVGDGVTVSTVGTPVLGEYEGPREAPVEGKPHVVLNGVALLGSVEVKRKVPKPPRKKWRG